jgi:thiamine pyrophosphokinase
MKKRAVVLTNGHLEDTAILRTRLEDWKGALVVAVDGGSQHARQLGLQIDVVIGDLDSLEPGTRRELSEAGTHFLHAPSQKDEIDLELALLHVAEQGVQQVAVLGATGGRLDMTMANVLLLTHPEIRSLHIEIWRAQQTAWLIRPPGGEIRGEIGDTLSLIPLGGDARGVTIEGTAYELKKGNLLSGPARGVSNVLTSGIARVELEDGTLLVVHTPGRA